ncbi:MAG: ThuA domain-containing protein, partial [Planctomycetota bacterium]
MSFLLLISLLSPGQTPPIKALLVTGGCCHDYNIQKLIISEGTAARARIEWVVVQEGGNKTNSRIPLHEKSDWAK